MKNKKRYALVAIWCMIGALPALAAYDLDPVVVTATKTRLELSKVPAMVSVISGDTIRDKQYQDVSQVLRDEPSIYIANYAMAGYTNSNSFYMNGSNSIVWMIDGIKMNNAGINPPLTALRNMQNVEKIEVLKGASSTLYGANAVGGVVNIITKQDYEGMHGGLNMSVGSYHTRNYSVYVNGGEDGWRYNFSFDKEKTGDFKDAHGLTIPSHRDGKSYSLMIGKKLNERHDFAITYDQYHADEMYSDSNQKLDVIRYGKLKMYNWRGVLTSQLTDRLENRFILMKNDYDSNYNGWASHIKKELIGDQLTWTPNDHHQVVAGYTWEQDIVPTSNHVKITNRAFYIQDTWKIDKYWSFTPGIRWDKYSSFGLHVTPHVALSYQANDKTQVYASYNSFFISPTPAQLYSEPYGDPNIKPEVGHTWEVGVHHRVADDMIASINAFKRNSKNKIGYDMSTNKYTNFDEEHAKGIAVDISKQWGDAWLLRAGYAFTDVAPTPQRARNVDGYIPRHQVTLGLQYHQDKWHGAFDLRGMIDRPGPQTQDALPHFFPKTTYWVADLSLDYQVTDSFKIFGRVNNIFNTFYAEHSNSRLNWGGKENEWWTAPGRNYLLGMSLSF